MSLIFVVLFAQIYIFKSFVLHLIISLGLSCYTYSISLKQSSQVKSFGLNIFGDLLVYLSQNLRLSFGILIPTSFPNFWCTCPNIVDNLLFYHSKSILYSFVLLIQTSWINLLIESNLLIVNLLSTESFQRIYTFKFSNLQLKYCMGQALHCY